MKWFNRSNLKEVNEAFIECLKVQYGDDWDMAYLRQDTVLAVGKNESKLVGFPETLEEMDKLEDRYREQQDQIMQKIVDASEKPVKELKDGKSSNCL